MFRPSPTVPSGRSRSHKPIRPAKKQAALSFLTGIKLDGAPTLSPVHSRTSDHVRELSLSQGPPRSQPIAINSPTLAAEAVLGEAAAGRARSVSLTESPAKKVDRPVQSKSRQGHVHGKRADELPLAGKSATPPVPGINFVNWSGTAESSLNDLRVILHANFGLPFCIFSIRPFGAEKSRLKVSSTEKANAVDPKRLISRLTGDLTCLDAPIPENPQREAVSFHSLLSSVHVKAVVAGGGADDTHGSFHRQLTNVSDVLHMIQSEDGQVEVVLSAPCDEDTVNVLREYQPFTLDDPDLRFGKHCTFMPLQSYAVSLLEYARPSAIKKDLNAQFHEKFPNVHLSLSKLRSLKNDMLDLVNDDRISLDLGTVALAYVYFEKLILLGKINKANRKYLAAISVLLAAKFSDATREVKDVIDVLADRFRLSRKSLLAAELPVVVALQFSLFVPESQVNHHFQSVTDFAAARN